MTTTTQDPSIANNKARREEKKADQKAAADRIANDRDLMIKSNIDKMAADAKLRPTPTVEEVQMAMAGYNKDVKEPDGSPEQNPHHHVVNAAQQIEVDREIPKAQSASPADDHRKADDTKPPASAKK
jgi:hypothetical protein